MQVSGKILVLATFAIGVAMATGAWLYNYQQSKRAALFWGPAAKLLVGSENVVLIELNHSVGPSAPVQPRGAGKEFDLTEKDGLVHLRHSLTYDGNFAWDQLKTEPFDAGRDWAYVLQFTRGDASVDVLFTRDFTLLGKLDSDRVDALPCPRLGPVIVEYLGKVGVPLATERVR